MPNKFVLLPLFAGMVARALCRVHREGESAPYPNGEGWGGVV